MAINFSFVGQILINESPETTLCMFSLNGPISPTYGLWLFLAHYDPEAIGHLSSTTSESPVIELPNVCFSFEIGHS